MQQRGDLYTLAELLPVAQAGGFAVGAFSARCTPMIPAILRAGDSAGSPLIVQIAQIELKWCQMTVEEFAEEFWRYYDQVRPGIPVGLHLDHTSDSRLIQSAIDSGFTSVMIDASDLSLEQNIAATYKVVEYAHLRNVSVEAELGRIGTAGFVETEADDVELFTDPQEAGYFVEQTGVDALAVSVGTAHGVYQVRRPRIDLERLKAIRSRTPVALVLHGGSGTPQAMITDAIRLPGGGVSKINFATDLELALLAELGMDARLPDAAMRAIPAASLERGAQAVQRVVEEKMGSFLGSRGAAAAYPGHA